ncbi:MAG: hypothetical protein KA436_04800 [Oligoflexales bacterium]|nr:hypothetical protein [Oligoflexales bacterium]
MKRNFLAIILVAHTLFSVHVYANEEPKSKKETSRETLISSLFANVKQSAPLIAYGVLGAFSGANMARKPEELIRIPHTTAAFHWVWTLGLFVLTTTGKVMECESSRVGGILGETLINAGFTGIIFATGYLTSLPVALGVTAAFVGAKVLHSGDNSPLEHLKPAAR